MNRLPAVICAICALLTGMILAITHFYPADQPALLVSNIIMCLLSLGAWYMLRRNVGERAYAFARGVQGATMLRLLVCAGGILIYALAKRPNVHKPTLFIMFGIYAVYMIIETLAFSRQARKV